MTKSSQVNLALIGSPDFGRRLTSLMKRISPQTQVFSGLIAEAWSLILTQRPQVVFFEIGPYHSERAHATLRKLLEKVRERSGEEIYTVVCLLAPEKLAYAGDLLFASDTSLAPSGFVDSFIAQGPSAIPNIPDLGQQVSQLLELLTGEFARRAEGKPALAPLGSPGWVQSLADPRSRELWLRWLPRYATYTNENPIIIGQTGTGKTNLAYALHKLSGRKGEFISITPRDFSSSELVQAELFGAVAGAYTGAVDKWGLVKSAEKGTLFIDELQSIDKELQGKLITFIENKFYRRVGSAETVEADVRFVFASNRSLYDMMESDILRHDFAYRLERVQLELLPLYQRRLDVTAALAHALGKVFRQRPLTRPIEGFSADAYRMLFGHRWPGNLRQLENCVAQLCEISDIAGERLIGAEAVHAIFQSRLSGAAVTGPEIITQAAIQVAQTAIPDSIGNLTQGVDQFITACRAAALEVSGGNWQDAAELIQEKGKVMQLFAQYSASQKELKN